MPRTPENEPSNPIKKLADNLRDFFLQALAQEDVVRQAAEAGQRVPRGSLYKIDDRT